jgi:hypothetical protein
VVDLPDKLSKPLAAGHGTPSLGRCLTSSASTTVEIDADDLQNILAGLDDIAQGEIATDVEAKVAFWRSKS